MSRPTVDIVADLRGMGHPKMLADAAADRLAELNAKVEAMEPRIQSAVQKVCDRFNMFRPPCPTCGGDGLGRDALGYVYQRPDPCPDCVDGKVSIEQLAATWRLARLPPLGEAMTTRSTADIVAALRATRRPGLTGPTAEARRPTKLELAAADRLETLQALLTLTTPTTIADELMELRLLAIENAARELEVIANAAWLQARLPHGAP